MRLTCTCTPALAPFLGVICIPAVMSQEVVWIRADEDGARYDHFPLASGNVSQLIAAWVLDVRPGAHRSRVSLRYVSCASSIPTKDEEARAREQGPLEPPLALAAAGVSSGSFLLATVARCASSSRSASEEESPPRPSPPNASERLQALLAEACVPQLSEVHLPYLREHFASQLLVATTAEDALRLRSRELQAPRSTTLCRLELHDLFVAREPLTFSASSRSLFLRASAQAVNHGC